MSKPQVIADWDGTIRRGFTIQDWVASLVRDALLPETVLGQLDEEFRRYRVGEITHDGLATVSAELVAKHLKGSSVARIHAHASDFAGRDAQHWFPFTKALLSYLRHKADVYVISGAPDLVVAPELTSWVPAERLFCLSFVEADGQFTGEIRTNPGTSSAKSAIARSLLSHISSPRFALAFGNAESDRPLFDAAEAVVIVENRQISVQREALRIDANTPPSEIIAFISARMDARE